MKHANAVVEKVNETFPNIYDEQLLGELRAAMTGARGVRKAARQGLQYVAHEIGRLECLRAFLNDRAW